MATIPKAANIFGRGAIGTKANTAEMIVDERLCTKPTRAEAWAALFGKLAMANVVELPAIAGPAASVT